MGYSLGAVTDGLGVELGVSAEGEVVCEEGAALVGETKPWGIQALRKKKGIRKINKVVE